ncbi:MAG: hypothetical protein QW837_06335 [Conexivisphaerales archaeon]
MPVGHKRKCKYCIVIPSYKPPQDILFVTLRKLSLNKGLKVFLVDASPNDISAKIFNQIELLKTEIGNNNINFFHIKHLGVGHTINYGVKQAIKNGYSLITILDDDASIIKDPLPVDDICEFFYNNCDAERDILVLPINKADAFQRTTKGAGDTGITISKRLFSRLRFREDFILDQIDLYFCNQVIKAGGECLVYPTWLIYTPPFRREVVNGFRVLPPWRYYLIARNRLIWAFETHSIIEFLSVLRDTGRIIIRLERTSFKAGQSTVEINRAIALGIFDAIKHRRGITDHLQILSNNRFDKD